MEDDFPVSCAYGKVALYADQVWWSDADFGDSYKLANFNLWIESVRLNELTPGNSDKTSHDKASQDPLRKAQLEKDQLWTPEELEICLPGCFWEEGEQDEFELPCPCLPAPLSQKILLDSNWLLDRPWPAAILSSYPSLPNAVNISSNSSLFSHNIVLEMLKSGNNFQYNIESLQELVLHNKIQCDVMRNIWENGERNLALKKKADVEGRRLNADVPEFYPSVLLPPNQSFSPTSFPSVFDANYQAELFPYKEEGQWEPLRRNSIEASSSQSVSPVSEGFGDWANKRLETEGKPTPSAKDAQPEQQKNQIYPRILNNFTPKKEPENLNDTRTWLESVYPRRGYEFVNLLAVANYYENLARQLIFKPEQMLPIAPSPLSISSDIAQDRILYRDVLARKMSEADDNEKINNDGTLENKFEELEREAIEQYRESDTCLVSPAVVTELSLEQDDRFQDLEREALEQYMNGEGSETAITESQEESEAKNEIGAEVSKQTPAVEPELLKKTALNKKLESNTTGSCSSSKKYQEEKTGKKIDIPTSRPYSKHHNYLTTQAKEEVLNDTGRYDEYLNKSQERIQKGKWRAKKPAKKKKPNKRQYFQHSTQVYCLEAETRRLATALKHKVLNYLKGVDLKLTEEKKKPLKKSTPQKDAASKSILQTVRLTDIQDAETYRLYVKEISVNARVYLQSLYKRVRSEIMETTSKGSVALVAPTSADKRRVRKTIYKCLGLLNHSDNMKKAAKKMLETARREVGETLRLVHKTMDVVYALRDMSEEVVGDVEFLKSGKELILALYRGSVTLEDKSDYIRQRVIREDRSLLAVLLFPRPRGILIDRTTDFVSKTNSLCVDFGFLMLHNEYTLRSIGLNQGVVKVCGKRFVLPSFFSPKLQHVYLCYLETRNPPSRRRYGLDPNYWIHMMEIGRKRYHVFTSMDMSARQAEMAPRILGFSKLPRTRFDETGGLIVEMFTQPPHQEPLIQRLEGVGSETDITKKPLKKNFSRRSRSWPQRPQFELAIPIQQMTASQDISPRKTKKSDTSCCLQ